MDFPQATLLAFSDELEKIAGGFTRSGVRPFKAETLAKHVGRFAKKGVMIKRSGVNASHVGAAALTGGALALYGERKGKKMMEDYRLGREIRKQQSAQGQQ